MTRGGGLQGHRLAVAVACGVLGLAGGCSEESSTHADASASSRTTSSPSPARAAAEARRRPNLVVITMDTTRADALGTYGQSLPTSPELDRVATEGVVFESVSSSSPETLPSHSTLFTALYPFDHGVRSNAGYRLDEANLTIAEILSARGYATAAEVASAVLRQPTGIDQGFAHYRDPTSGDVDLETREETADAGHQETSYVRVGADITRRGIEFLRARRSDPFFLWLHYFEPHAPYNPPPSLQREFPKHPYYAEVALMDGHIARVLDEIERLGLRASTLVVLTADHGESLYEHDEPSHAFLVYETTIRVPLVLWGLDTLPAGRRVREPVRTVDVASTIFELLGVPKRAMERGGGRSLVPLLRGAADAQPRPAYAEATSAVRIFGIPPVRSLREGRWKYIHKPNPELYDLEGDPSEQSNRIEAHPDVAERLRRELLSLVRAADPVSEGQAEIDAQTARQLAALGYAQPETAGEHAIRDDDEALSLDGPDINRRMQDVRIVSTANGRAEAGRYAEALEILGDLREREPDSPFIQNTVHRALVGLGRYAEALPLLEASIAREPEDVRIRQRYVEALSGLSRTDDAIEAIDEGLARSVCFVPYYNDLDAVLRAAERYAELVARLEEGIASCPEEHGLVNNLAWALATLPEASLRDGARAESLARAAAERAGGEDPGMLDTLAAAIAEQGRFDEAARVQRRALARVERAGYPAPVVAAMRAHLAAFEAGRPVREPTEGAGSG